MRGRLTATIGLVATALLATGCGSPNAGAAAQDEIRALLQEKYGEHVEEVRISKDDALPWAGGAFGSVALKPETSPEVFAEVLELMDSFEPESGAFDGTGVVANGVGVCFGDPQREQRQALRDALHAADATLAGDWPCPVRTTTDDWLPYVGTAAELDADLRVVRDLPGRRELTLEGEVQEPRGSVSVDLDDPPLTLVKTLDAAERASGGVARFELVDNRLEIAVAPTADLAPIQAAATEAAGKALQVTVVQGTLDAERRDDLADLGPVVDALRAIPGVDEVTATGGVVVRVPDPKRVQQVHDDAVDVPGVDALWLTLEVGPADNPRGPSTWVRPAGGSSDSIESFAALVTRPEVEHLSLREADGKKERALNLQLAGPLSDVVRLRRLLPVEAPLTVLSRSDDTSVILRLSADRDIEDLESIHEDVDLAAFRAAWATGS